MYFLFLCVRGPQTVREGPGCWNARGGLERGQGG